MAEFICNNEDCSNHKVVIYNGYVTYRMHGMDFLADERFCLMCGKEMEEIKKNSGTDGFFLKESFGSINKNWSKPNKNAIY
jgi:hypothetical protein